MEGFPWVVEGNGHKTWRGLQALSTAGWSGQDHGRSSGPLPDPRALRAPPPSAQLPTLCPLQPNRFAKSEQIKETFLIREEVRMGTTHPARRCRSARSSVSLLFVAVSAFSSPQSSPRVYRRGRSRCRFCAISLTQRFQAQFVHKQYFPIA